MAVCFKLSKPAARYACELFKRVRSTENGIAMITRSAIAVVRPLGVLKVRFQVPSAFMTMPVNAQPNFTPPSGSAFLIACGICSFPPVTW